MTTMEKLARIRRADRELIEKFLRLEDWKRRITAVIVMTASPEDAMKREKGYLPVENGGGTIMSREVLQQVLDTTLDCVARVKNDFRIYTIDTSFGEAKDNPRRTAEIVADVVLGLIEEQIKEEVLCVEKSKVVASFSGRHCLVGAEALQLADTFINSGKFLPRDEVESNPTLVQALPIVVVRNRSGDVLRLRRREKTEDNPLHQKVVIWAGGHVRQEDSTTGGPLLQCAVREL